MLADQITTFGRKRNTAQNAATVQHQRPVTWNIGHFDHERTSRPCFQAAALVTGVAREALLSGIWVPSALALPQQQRSRTTSTSAPYLNTPRSLCCAGLRSVGTSRFMMRGVPNCTGCRARRVGAALKRARSRPYLEAPRPSMEVGCSEILNCIDN